MRTTIVGCLSLDNSEEAFVSLFPNKRIAYDLETVKALDENKIVILFRGGEDIHPSLYGEERVSMSGAPKLISSRDAFEASVFKYAVSKGIPMLGICRGSQFLCAMSGGKLVQDVTGHGQTHEIMSDKGELYMATSTHHQMMFPWMHGVKHKLIAWSVPKLSQFYVFNPRETKREIFAEPEIIFFPQTKALAIQGHPEYKAQDYPYTVYCNQLVKEYLL